MGQNPLDQFTLLHFSVGVVAYFWGVGAWLLLVAHLAFEFIENTHAGVKFINTWLTLWPGGKPAPDSATNSIADTAATMVGWLVSRWLDSVSKEKHLYRPLLNLRTPLA